jgi:hypothetical protein
VRTGWSWLAQVLDGMGRVLLLLFLVGIVLAPPVVISHGGHHLLSGTLTLAGLAFVLLVACFSIGAYQIYSDDQASVTRQPPDDQVELSFTPWNVLGVCAFQVTNDGHTDWFSASWVDDLDLRDDVHWDAIASGSKSKELGHAWLPIPERRLVPGEVKRLSVRFTSRRHRPLDVPIELRLTLLGNRQVRLADGQWPEQDEDWRRDVSALLARLRVFRENFDKMSGTANLTPTAPDRLYEALEKEVRDCAPVGMRFLDSFRSTIKLLDGRSDSQSRMPAIRAIAFKQECDRAIGRLELGLAEPDEEA